VWLKFLLRVKFYAAKQLHHHPMGLAMFHPSAQPSDKVAAFFERVDAHLAATHDIGMRGVFLNGHIERCDLLLRWASGELAGPNPVGDGATVLGRDPDTQRPLPAAFCGRAGRAGLGWRGRVMSDDLIRFIVVVWPYAAGFALWIAACAYAESRHDVSSSTLNRRAKSSRPVLVTTEYRGVFFGYADDTTGDTIILTKARNCVYLAVDARRFWWPCCRRPCRRCQDWRGR